MNLNAPCGGARQEQLPQMPGGEQLASSHTLHSVPRAQGSQQLLFLIPPPLFLKEILPAAQVLLSQKWSVKDGVSGPCIGGETSAYFIVGEKNIPLGPLHWIIPEDLPCQLVEIADPRVVCGIVYVHLCAVCKEGLHREERNPITSLLYMWMSVWPHDLPWGSHRKSGNG